MQNNTNLEEYFVTSVNSHAHSFANPESCVPLFVFYYFTNVGRLFAVAISNQLRFLIYTVPAETILT